MKVGFIAHDAKKRLLQDFCVAYKGILSRHELYATGSTGTLIEDASHMRIHKFISGPLGGVEQMIAQIEANDLDLVIFLRDPNQKSHEPSITDVFKTCDIHNIPLATNIATAELLVMALDRGDFEFREAYR